MVAKGEIGMMTRTETMMMTQEEVQSIRKSHVENSPALLLKCFPGYIFTENTAKEDGQTFLDSSTYFPPLAQDNGFLSFLHHRREHLYRQHLILEICNRCYEALDEVDQLISHQRSNEPCEKKDRRPSDGIDATQLPQLKSKKRHGGSEYEKCERIYRIIWPEEDSLPCPCKLPFAMRLLE